MDKQILFLYSAIRGYLDWMPVELVPVYEDEFYRYYLNDVMYWPFKSTLDFKDNSLDEDATSFLIWHFSALFIGYAKENFDFKV
jgi:hypothetical protein